MNRNRNNNKAWWQRRSTVLPAVFLVYTAAMAWLGRSDAGNWQYWAIIAGCVAVNVALHIVLRRRERLSDEA